MKQSAKCVFEGRSQNIPPLSQSRQADMACQSLYIRKHIIGGPMAETEAAARGTEVHEILATYINHLLRARRRTDLGFLDCLLTGSGNNEVPEALEKFRENHAFDPEQILGTEIYIALDREFKPLGCVSLDGQTQGPVRGATGAYEGTLDLVLVPSVTKAEIHDWKSYYQIIDPDTFQSKFYPLLLMCLNPSLQRVKFVLEFIRYGASRSVEYTRQDVPRLKELAQRERARQEKLHRMTVRGSASLKASPGRHCTWCPLLLDGCPVGRTNPYGQLSAEERVRFALWLQEAEKQNAKTLRDLMVEHGPVQYCDENQQEYVADFVPVEKRFYPYQKALPVLNEWLQSHPEDRGFVEKLTVSGLSSPLKAQKRARLAEKLIELAEVRVDTELKIGRARESDVGSGDGP